MTDLTKATPRPWQRSGTRSRTQAGWPFISIGHGDDSHCILVLYGRTNEEQIAAEQDARLIVRAVNLHDELVAALRNMTERYVNLAGGCFWDAAEVIAARDLLAKVDTP